MSMRVQIRTDMGNVLIFDRVFIDASEIAAMEEGLEDAMVVMQSCGVLVDTDGWIEDGSDKDWDIIVDQEGRLEYFISRKEI